MANCPLAIEDYDEIQLAHGEGGKLTHQLIEQIMLPAFDNEYLNRGHDGAVFNVGDRELAFTTDSYVVDPLFFPGGNIGELAVHGTVNDLAMCGARSDFLSAGLIIEEGFPMVKVRKIVQSMEKAATAVEGKIVTGDTKVVGRGKGDGIYINTAGVGEVKGPGKIGSEQIKAGDKIIVNGDVGRHGMAVMSEREGLEFKSEISSDTAPLRAPVARLLEAEIPVHCLRDLTRGGLATNLNELIEGTELGVEIKSADVPVREEVKAACEILGLDPFYVACEGRMLIIVPPEYEQNVLDNLENSNNDYEPATIGKITKENPGMVEAESQFGSSRVLELKSGSQLPRIC